MDTKKENFSLCTLTSGHGSENDREHHGEQILGRVQFPNQQTTRVVKGQRIRPTKRALGETIAE